MAAPLSAKTRRHLEALFAMKLRPVAEALLVESCGNNLPFLERASSAGLERVRFAALKVSDGELEALERAVKLGQTDWRDLLLAAGFGAVDAHEAWRPEPRYAVGPGGG